MATSIVCCVQYLVPKCIFKSLRPLAHTHVLGRNFSKKSNFQENYLVKKLTSLTDMYHRFLKARFPRLFPVYEAFTIGTKDCFKDMIIFGSTIARLSKEGSYTNLSRLELETLYQIPKDIRKIFPTIFIACLPFTIFIVLPLVYKFPRQLLSKQYWTQQQKVDFPLYYHQQKLRNYKPVYESLKREGNSITAPEIKEICTNVFQKLDSGGHPDTIDLLKMQTLFCQKPYGIFDLSTAHLSSLCQLHGLTHRFPWKRLRLYRKGVAVYQMDQAIAREGVHGMAEDELRYACFLRGLNPIGLPSEELGAWLGQWVSVTKHLQRTEISMLLHCPIFLAYNYATNREDIHT